MFAFSVFSLLTQVFLKMGWTDCPSFHEMGIYDVPAVTDKIISVTGANKIFYVGHSMGTTQYFIGLSEIPSLNNKVKHL